MSIQVARPKTIEIKADIIPVNKKEIWVQFKDLAIYIRKGKSFEINIWGYRNGKITLVGTFKLDSPFDISTYDIDDELKNAILYVIEHWDFLQQQKVAEIILSARIRAFPSRISEKERLAREIALKLIEEYNAASISIRYDKLYDHGVHCFRDGVWIPCEEELKNKIGELLHPYQKPKVTREVVSEVLANQIRLERNIEIDGTTIRPIIAFKNLFFDWERFLETGDLEKSLLEPDPTLFVQHRIPHYLNLELLKEVRKGLEIYIPPTSTKDILRILRELSPGTYNLLESWAYFEGINKDLLESRIAFLLEMIGRAMFPGYHAFGSIVFKDVFLLLGPTDSGKSTFLQDFMGKTILGEENYKPVRLRYLGTDNEETLWKTLADLYNVLAVLALDVGKREKVSDWSVIRDISGGSAVTARRLYKNPFKYQPAYKIYISSNDPPPINETGVAREALLSRFKVIEFKNIFKKGELELKKLLSEQDIEVIIIAALYSLRLVRQRKKYSFTGIADVESIILEYTYPEYKIVRELIEVGKLKLDPTLRISSSDLYQLCFEWLREKRIEEEEEEEDKKKMELPSQSAFTKRLKKLLARYGVKTVVAKGKTYFVGIGEPVKGFLK